MNFNANDYEAPSFEPIPKGEYPMMIVESDVAENAKKNGRNLKLVSEIIDGQYKGRKIYSTLAFENPSEMAVKIARGLISAICHAVGIAAIQDTTQLHNKPFLGKVGISKGQDGYDDSNDLKSAKALEGQQAGFQGNFQGQQQGGFQGFDQNQNNGFNQGGYGNGNQGGFNQGGYGQFSEQQNQNQQQNQNNGFGGGNTNGGNGFGNQNAGGQGFGGNQNFGGQQQGNSGYVDPNQGQPSGGQQQGNGFQGGWQNNQQQQVDNSAVPAMEFNNNQQQQNTHQQNTQGQQQGNGDKPPWA